MQCEQRGVAEGIGAAREAARRPEVRHLAHEQSEIQAADLQEHAPESHPLATNLTVANGSAPAPRCPSLTATSATPIRTFRLPPLRGRTREPGPNAPDGIVKLRSQLAK